MNLLFQEDVMEYLSESFSRSDCEILHQSGKLNVVMCLLEGLRDRKEKVVLVSYFTQVTAANGVF